jgi:cold-inducible RNA-binding protein
MGKKLYVGNLPFSVNDQSLSDHFASAGTVESAKVIIDRETGRSRGFAFVEMSTDDEAQTAIDRLHQQDFQGRNITVNEARPQPPRTNNFGGGGGGRR